MLRSLLQFTLALCASGCLFQLPSPTGGGGGATGGGGGGGSVTGGGGGGGQVQQCPSADAGTCAGVAYETSGVFDLNVRRVTVSGSVRLNGATLPTVAGGRGAVVFERPDVGEVARVPLQTTGALSYALSLSAGDYVIAYEPDDVSNWRLTSRLCSASSTPPPMPCVGGVLRRITLSADGALDLDITSVQVTGSVTMNGGTLPTATGPRGALHFTLADGGDARSQSLGASGAVTYAVHLLSGSYQVLYDSEQSPCPRGWAMPCNVGALLRSSELRTNGALDVDLPAAQISGVLRQNGADLPAASGQRGRLEFRRGSETPFWFASFAAAGVADYSLWLIKGRYTTVYRAEPSACNGQTAPAVTCTGAAVAGCN